MRLVKLTRSHKSLFPGETGGFSDEEAARLVAAGVGVYGDGGERAGQSAPAQHAPASELVVGEPATEPAPKPAAAKKQQGKARKR